MAPSRDGGVVFRRARLETVVARLDRDEPVILRWAPPTRDGGVRSHEAGRVRGSYDISERGVRPDSIACQSGRSDGLAASNHALASATDGRSDGHSGKTPGTCAIFEDIFCVPDEPEDAGSPKPSIELGDRALLP